ncbi:hypothetical protein THOM_3164, partial [Trachipleistophora hominis]
VHFFILFFISRDTWPRFDAATGDGLLYRAFVVDGNDEWWEDCHDMVSIWRGVRTALIVLMMGLVMLFTPLLAFVVAP